MSRNTSTAREASVDAQHSYPSLAPWLAATSVPSKRSASSIFLPAASATAAIGPALIRRAALLMRTTLLSCRAKSSPNLQKKRATGGARFQGRHVAEVAKKLFG